jgi:hypothetical protein
MRVLKVHGEFVQSARKFEGGGGGGGGGKLKFSQTVMFGFYFLGETSLWSPKLPYDLTNSFKF